jgi:hypothetical protein
MVAIETSIESLAAQLQNETLKDILARDTIDLLTLTFRTHVLCRHYISPDITSGGSKDHSGMTSGNDIRERHQGTTSGNDIRERHQDWMPPVAGAAVAG